MAKDAIRVLHLSTHNEECGIAIFQQNIVEAMNGDVQVENTFFDVSPNTSRNMNEPEFRAVVKKLEDELSRYDILHIQHEYSFYRDNQLARYVQAAKKTNKKVVFTLHTPPHAHRQGVLRRAPRGFTPRTWLHAFRVAKEDKKFVDDYISPLANADAIVVNSRASLDSFAEYGLARDKMSLIELPVPEVDRAISSNQIVTAINRQEGDVILSTAGFISESKGIAQAIKALSYLPQNYKLAIVGGPHPSGQNDSFYDHACDLIVQLGLKDRVCITGYVENDKLRDALLRETDICLYPYDRHYYDYVSSAALTNAVANSLPIVAFKTKTFLEANETVPFIYFCKSANYYELARSVQEINLIESRKLVKDYAERLSVKKQAARFIEMYAEVINE